jgi:hypothetical protein
MLRNVSVTADSEDSTLLPLTPKTPTGGKKQFTTESELFTMIQLIILCS